MNRQGRAFLGLNVGLACLLLVAIGPTPAEAHGSHPGRATRVRECTQSSSAQTGRIAKHVAGYARDVRWRLNDFVTQADNQRVTVELFRLLRWKLGGAVAVCAQYVSTGYSHFEKSYADEAAALYLGVISFSRQQPEIVVPTWMLDILKWQLETDEAILKYWSVIFPANLAVRVGQAVLAALENNISGKVTAYIPKGYDVDNRLVEAAIKAKRDAQQLASQGTPVTRRGGGRAPSRQARIQRKSSLQPEHALKSPGKDTAAPKAQVTKRRAKIKPQQGALSLDPCSVTGTWLPPGSRTRSNPDGSVTVLLPRGYRALPYDNAPATRYRAGSSFTIDCTCTKGKGDCSPIKVPGRAPSCVIGPGCDACDRKGSALVIMGKGDIRYARSADSGSLPAGDPEKLLRVTEVRKRLNAFLQKSNRVTVPGRLSGKAPAPIIRGESFIAPKGYVFTPLNVYGYLVYTLISAESASAMRLAGFGRYSCTCKSGASGCKKDRKGPIYGCTAGECKSCSLTGFMGGGRISARPARTRTPSSMVPATTSQARAARAPKRTTTQSAGPTAPTRTQKTARGPRRVTVPQFSPPQSSAMSLELRSLPDLVPFISRHQGSCAESNCYQCPRITLLLGVKNVAAFAAMGTITVQVYHRQEGSLVASWTVNGVAGGATVIVGEVEFFPWNCGGGYYQGPTSHRVVIDAGNSVAERNEDNNAGGLGLRHDPHPTFRAR